MSSHPHSSHRQSVRPSLCGRRHRRRRTESSGRAARRTGARGECPHAARVPPPCLSLVRAPSLSVCLPARLCPSPPPRARRPSRCRSRGPLPSPPRGCGWRDDGESCACRRRVHAAASELTGHPGLSDAAEAPRRMFKRRMSYRSVQPAHRESGWGEGTQAQREGGGWEASERQREGLARAHTSTVC